MTQEEKAKRFDEALEELRGLLEGIREEKCKILEEDIISIFPELKESEDEKIRKELIAILKGQIPYTSEEDAKRYIAWLEKQGKQKPQGKTALEAINEEKVDNSNKVESKDYNSIDPLFSKPVDKIEPKFHEGDWIIHRGTENIYQVVAVIDNQYQLKYGDNYTVQNCTDVDRCARLYDVTKDAKAGDVLATEDVVFIFKHIDKTGLSLCKSYCEVIGNSELGLGFDFSIYDVYPASKEQRELLFHKVKEAGYEWDADKKELRKIEKNPTDKVESKFKVGDWVVHNDDGCICQIKSISEDDYCLGPIYSDVAGYFKITDIDNKYHLWTIEDAKAGDVIFYNSGWTCIFKCIHGIWYSSYCFITDDGEFHTGYEEHLVNAKINGNANPATKEQRDLLFQKMKEEGYVWDAEKKQLRTIECNKPNFCHHEVDLSNCSEEYRKAYYDGWNNCNQQHSQLKAEQTPIWSEEDETALSDALWAIKQAKTIAKNENMENIWYAEKWLKALKNKYIQKADDEHYELEEFAKIVRSNLTGISKAVQTLFENKYLKLTGKKMYGNFKD